MFCIAFPIICNSLQCCFLLQKGWSPLLVAALRGNVEIVDSILKSGANVDLALPVSI